MTVADDSAPCGLEAIIRDHLDEDMAELLQDETVRQMASDLAGYDLRSWMTPHGAPTADAVMRCSREWHRRSGRTHRGAFYAIAAAVLQLWSTQ